MSSFKRLCRCTYYGYKDRGVEQEQSGNQPVDIMVCRNIPIKTCDPYGETRLIPMGTKMNAEEEEQQQIVAGTVGALNNRSNAEERLRDNTPAIIAHVPFIDAICKPKLSRNSIVS